MNTTRGMTLRLGPASGRAGAEDRRHAAGEAAIRHARFVAFARRFTGNFHDAEEAFSRALEISLAKAPARYGPRFEAWFHTVLRREALALVRGRRRELPTEHEELERAAGGRPDDGDQYWRQTRRALALVRPAERVCLVLHLVGADYEEISERTGFSRRKVERSILRGRERLRRAVGEA